MKKIFFIMSIILILPFVQSSYIGLSPANANFEGILRGGYAERSVIITVNIESPVQVESQLRGAVAGWVNLSAQNFSVSKSQPYPLKISINPPIDIPNGNYSGFLRLKVIQEGEIKEDYATGVVQTALDLGLKVEITDFEVTSCEAFEFEINSVEKGDFATLKTSIKNNGNIRLRPKIRVDIWDQEQMRIVKTEEFIAKEILPTTTEKLSYEISSKDLEVEQYWAEVSVIECYSSSTLTFDVLDIGALKSSGELTKILVNLWYEKGDNVNAKVFFKNTGEKRVDAQFKGTVSLDGKIVEIVESDFISVEMGEEEVFELYLSPKKEGKYILTGRVFYDKKRTFEKSAIFNIVSKEKGVLKWVTTMIYLFFILGIILLIYKIRKIRNKMRYFRK
jgi:hypothetical protein